MADETSPEASVTEENASQTITDLADLGSATAPVEAPLPDPQIDAQGRSYATASGKMPSRACGSSRDRAAWS